MASYEQIDSWWRGRLPDDWFVAPAAVSVDREEIVVTGRLPLPDGVTEADASALEPSPETVQAAEGRIARFREETREERIAIAREAEHRFGRKVAWAARCGPVGVTFTHLAAPVMTRLRQPERTVLDTLVEAGVARSRADALAWCVRLVGQHTGDWLEELRTAMTGVQRLRDQGPPAA